MREPGIAEAKMEERYCRCGCGNTLKKKSNKNNKRLILYIHGHNTLGRKDSVETKIKKSNLMKKRWESQDYRDRKKLELNSYYNYLRSRKPEQHPLFGRVVPKDRIDKRISTMLKKYGVKSIPGNKGEKCKDTTKNKISLANKGKRYSISTEFKKGSQLSYERRLQIKKLWNTPEKILFAKKRRAKQIFPIKDSSIEVKIHNFLQELNIKFSKHKYLEIEDSYQCHIFIESMNLIIECDGEYWHNYPKGRDIDHKRVIQLKEKGYKVIRLWEREINSLDLQSFKRRLEYA